MKIALVFPGYGSQHVGMGKELYDEYRIVQEYFEEASNCVNINFVKLCFASSDSEISKLAHAYLSLFVIGGAVFALLKENGITPDVVAGYNNGETAALFAAGCFSFPDGLYLLNKMCSFYEELLQKMDVAVVSINGLSADKLASECKKIDSNLSIAFYNKQDEHIVVGSSNQVSMLHDAVELYDGVKTDYLTAEVGLHSFLMNEVINQFKDYLEKVDFKDVVLPVISGLDGALVMQGSELKDRFVRTINEPINFVAVTKRLADYDMIIIATPAQALGKLLKKEYPEKTIVTIDKKADIEAFKEVVQSGI